MRLPAKAVLIVAALSAGPAFAQDPPETQERERTVRSVRFAGNQSIDDLILAMSIETTGRQGFWLVKLFGGGERSRFDEVEFRRDVLRLQLLYRRFGFFEARVDTTVRRREEDVEVTFRITEGPPVMVDSITLVGLEAVPGADRIARRLPSRVGRPFSRFEFDASADTLVAFLRAQGYPFPEIFRNYSVDRVNRLARLEFDVVPGTFARIGAIETRGSSTVTGRTLRRVVGLKEGDPFSQQRLTRGQLALYRTDLFRYANVGIAADSPFVGGGDSLVRVRVQVTDAQRTRLRAGVGYGTTDCLRTSSQFSLVNFVGGARRLDVTSRVSKIAGHADSPLRANLCNALAGDRFSDRVNFYNDVTVTQPALLGRPVQIALSVFAERTGEFNAYERSSTGSALTLGLPLARWPVALTYRLERSRTDADDATFCIAFDQCEGSTVTELKRYRRQATLTLAMVDARTNSPLDPTSGRVLSAQLATSHPAIGSQVAFNRALGEAAFYRSYGRYVVAARLRGGVVRAGDVTVSDTTFTFIPPSERFYAGGATSVRGFARNAMGPVVYVADSVTGDPFDPACACIFNLRRSPLGSNAVALANLELRAPSPFLPARLGLAFFVDAGQLWQDTPAGWVPSGIRVTPGMGLRIATPLGPMRLDVAYSDYANQPGRLYELNAGRLDVVTDGFAIERGTRFVDRLAWHFSVGQAF